MIIDALCDSSLYEGLNPLFKQAFDYIKSLDLDRVEAGRTELVEGELIVMVNETSMKVKEDARMEVHNAYIDIHVPISGEEGFSWKNRKDLKNAAYAFDEEKDAQHYEDEPEMYFSVLPGSFVLFFPHDGHAGCIGEGEIKKIVVKVKVC